MFNPMEDKSLGACLADQQLHLIFSLSEMRMKKNITIDELAQKSGLTRSEIFKFESGGSNPTMSTIRKYAKAVKANIIINITNWE